MFCTNCGERAHENSRFCASCGTPISAASAPGETPGAGSGPESLPAEQQELLALAEAGDENAMFELAGWFRGIGNLESAIFRYRQLVDRGDPFASFELGLIREGTDDEEAEKLLLFTANTTEAAFSAEKLGEHYARRGKNAEAKKWYLTALEWLERPEEDDYTTEEVSDIYLNLALVLKQLGESEAAQESLQNSADLGNGQAEAELRANGSRGHAKEESPDGSPIAQPDVKGSNSQIVIKTNGLSFSPEQLTEVEESARILADVVAQFGISPERISMEEAERISATDPHRVFTIIDRLGDPILPGFFEDELEYLVSKVPIDKDSKSFPYPETQLEIPCALCEGSEVVGEDEDECPDCEVGSFIFQLEWDENGVVTADASSA